MKRLELSDPIKPFVINQRFGETKVDYGPGRVHEGYDLGVAFKDQPCFAVEDCYVYRLLAGSRAGISVQLITTEPYRHEENGQVFEGYWVFTYLHLKSWNSKLFNGGMVKKNEEIGICDNTGYSSGDHLHIDGKPVIGELKENINITTNHDYFAKEFFSNQFKDVLNNPATLNRAPIESAFYWDEYHALIVQFQIFLAKFKKLLGII